MKQILLYVAVVSWGCGDRALDPDPDVVDIVAAADAGADAEDEPVLWAQPWVAACTVTCRNWQTEVTLSGCTEEATLAPAEAAALALCASPATCSLELPTCTCALEFSPGRCLDDGAPPVLDRSDEWGCPAPLNVCGAGGGDMGVCQAEACAPQ